MNTKLLYEKIDRFEKVIEDNKLSKKFLIEIVNDFKIWLIAIEKVNGGLEFDIISLNFKIKNLEFVIDQYKKLLLITGNGSVLIASTIMDNDKFSETIEFLFKNKDRFNSKNIYQIGKLLELAKNEGIEIETITDLVRYAKGN